MFKKIKKQNLQICNILKYMILIKKTFYEKRMDC